MKFLFMGHQGVAQLSGTSPCDPFIGDKTVTDFVGKKTGNFL